MNARELRRKVDPTMADDGLQVAPLPRCRKTSRKHDLGVGRFETLRVLEVPAFNFQGRDFPHIVFGSGMLPNAAVQSKHNASDTETAQRGLDGGFSNRFPEHACTPECTEWTDEPTDDIRVTVDKSGLYLRIVELAPEEVSKLRH